MRYGMPVLKQIKQHKLLLDTHVWIWLVSGNALLSKKCLNAIERCAEQDDLSVSSISVWELAMLVEKKRISLEMDRLDWVERALSVPGISLVPLLPRIAIQSTRLPGKIHGDPADRMLIETARHFNSVLITHDEKILSFGKGRFINVYDPCR